VREPLIEDARHWFSAALQRVSHTWLCKVPLGTSAGMRFVLLQVEVVPWIGYMRPNMTIQVVDHFMAHTVGGVPPQVGATWRVLVSCSALWALPAEWPSVTCDTCLVPPRLATGCSTRT
jgi:hypothetical protein